MKSTLYSHSGFIVVDAEELQKPGCDVESQVFWQMSYEGRVGAALPPTAPMQRNHRRSPLLCLVLCPLPVLPVLMNCFTGGFHKWCSHSKLPSSWVRELCRVEQHIAPWAPAVRSLLSPGFLLCCWLSWLVASTSGESLESHLGFPMPEQGYAPTAPTSLLLGQFMFSFGCWVSWNHIVCSSSSDRVKHSCITPTNCSRRLFSTTPLVPYTFPVFYTDHFCFVADCEVRTVFQTPNVGFSYCNL